MLQVLATIAALIAAAGAAWAAFETRRAASGPLLLQLIERYGSAEMNAALQQLAEWEEQHSGNSSAAFQELRHSDPDRWREINAARRLVKSYFFHIHSLYEAGTLTWRAARESLAVAGFELFERVVRPLEVTTANPRDDRYEQLIQLREELNRKWMVLRGDFS